MTLVIEISGIYKILNKINGKFYIGSAVDYAKRWREHKYHLNRQTHKNPHLQAAWNKYGEHAFDLIIIEPIKDKLIEREQFYIDVLKPEYNIALTAGSRAGIPMPQSAKDKIGKNSKLHMTGRKMLPQTKEALIKANIGNKHCLGYKQSLETISKRAMANTGKTRTKETKARMSAAKIGINFSDSHKANQSLAAKRRWDAYRAAKQ